ncbi:growth hormone-regulated TBC protein 1-A-like isoform X1 [Coccinella septempunctata]|uniref:growth hormone-regulated TBC protein 1-A-like isoform X1 n=2 Tax=Coccinella septempunctata TaxID=41139 RepID=UPI001D071F3A|nr:growth hormone-regulated TBC protein 1-A-like isoform X1 [Coccinella septempunctata]
MARPMFSKVDEYGFERPENFNYQLHAEFMEKYMHILVKRGLRWATLKGKNKYARGNKLKRFIRKGVPIDLRPTVWMQVSGAQVRKENNSISYTDLKKNIGNPALIEMIKIDLPRTFPDNINFISQEYLIKQMFNVLATFAHQNSEVGYCQGLNYITGMLLLATKNEEVSFWLLKELVENILPKYSVTNMSGLLVDLDVLDELVKKFDPEVHRHIQKIGMPWAMVTTKWFICLFVEVLPTETVLRIWDCIFYEGSKIIFRVGLTLIKLHKVEILRTKELSELIACFKEMRNHKEVVDCHQFMTNIFKIPGKITDSELQKLRLKYSKTQNQR